MARWMEAERFINVYIESLIVIMTIALSTCEARIPYSMSDFSYNDLFNLQVYDLVHGGSDNSADNDSHFLFLVLVALS